MEGAVGKIREGEIRGETVEGMRGSRNKGRMSDQCGEGK